MRRLCGRMGLALLMVWVGGCGSTGGTDALVLHFLHFDSTGLTQADSVRETSADVDNSPDSCQSGGQITAEPFTQTIINAVFRNEEAADLHLTSMVIDLGPTSGRGTITRAIDGSLPGGLCSNIDQQCASDADCFSASTGSTGSCVHTDTTITGILLFDFDDKLATNTGTYNASITFFATDPNHTFETRTSYVVRFDNFDNCPGG